MAIVFDTALCLRHWDWSETSQTVQLFTRTHGMVRGVAKGAKRERGNFSGGIELLTLGEIGLSLRKHETPGALLTLAAWDLHEVFPGIARSMHAFRGAFALADAIGHALPEADPYPHVFDELAESLRAMNQGDAHSCARIVTTSLLRLLSHTGHAPEFENDVQTGEPLPRAKTYAFSPAMGGLTIDTGADSGPNGVLWRTRASTRECLRALREGNQAVDHHAVARSGRLLAMYYRSVFDCDAPALVAWAEFLETHSGD